MTEITAVTELLQYASYDQIVLTVCFLAVALSGAIMHFSAHLTGHSRREQTLSPTRTTRIRLARAAAQSDERRDKAA